MKLEQELQAAIAANPIGTPVAIRMNIVGASESSVLTAVAIEFAASVFDSEAVRLGCQSDSESGYTSSIVEYADGQTASINTICAPNTSATIELLLIGNQRTLQLDLDDCELDSAAPDSALIATVGRACQTGKTTVVGSQS